MPEDAVNVGEATAPRRCDRAVRPSSAVMKRSKRPRPRKSALTTPASSRSPSLRSARPVLVRSVAAIPKQPDRFGRTPAPRATTRSGGRRRRRPSHGAPGLSPPSSPEPAVTSAKAGAPTGPRCVKDVPASSPRRTDPRRPPRSPGAEAPRSRSCGRERRTRANGRRRSRREAAGRAHCPRDILARTT